MAIPFRGATLSNTCPTECDLADPDYGQFAVSPCSHLAAEWVIGRLEWLVVVLVSHQEFIHYSHSKHC